MFLKKLLHLIYWFTNLRTNAALLLDVTFLGFSFCRSRQWQFPPIWGPALFYSMPSKDLKIGMRSWLRKVEAMVIFNFLTLTGNYFLHYCQGRISVHSCSLKMTTIVFQNIGCVCQFYNQKCHQSFNLFSKLPLSWSS